MHHQTATREARLVSDDAPLPTLETGLVAVCPGRGNRRLFESLGATEGAIPCGQRCCWL